MLSITRNFTFEAAHRISNHPGLCKNIHGHSYKLQVTVAAIGELTQHMVMDFKELKSLVNQYIIEQVDHALILKKGTHPNEVLTTLSTKLLLLDDEPTAEVLLQYFAHLLIPHLPHNVTLTKLHLTETEQCFASWENN